MKPIVVTLALASIAALCPLHVSAEGKAGQDKAAQTKSADDKAEPADKKSKPDLDRSGKTQHGEASYYAKRFSGRTMADGTPMDPKADIAASRTLPLGTKAEVVNLENGKRQEVEIRDRGPYVDGRIVDVSPGVAKKLDMEEDGVAKVLVKPIEVPQADGSIKAGTGAGEMAGTTSGKSGTSGTVVSSPR